MWTTETAQESNRWLIVSEKRRGRQSYGRRQPTVSLAEPREKRTTRRFFASEALCFELLSYCFFYSFLLFLLLIILLLLFQLNFQLLLLLLPLSLIHI